MVPLIKIENPRAVMAFQFITFVVIMFSIEMFFLDASVPSAVFACVFNGVFAVALLTWLARRSRT